LDLQENKSNGINEDPHQYMLDLAKKYSTFFIDTSISSTARIKRANNGETIVSSINRCYLELLLIIVDQLLTGGTGSLGTFLINKLSRLPKNIVSKIICLVRAPNDMIAKQRIFDELEIRDLDFVENRVEIYSSRLGEDRLGLESAVYDRLVREVDVVVHVSDIDGNGQEYADGTSGCLAGAFYQ
jgi:hypothetical protein